MKFPWVNIYIINLGVLTQQDREDVVKAYSEERDKKSLTKCEQEMLSVTWVDASDLYKALVLKKKTDTVKLKSFFRKELARGMEEILPLKGFCERRGIAIKPLGELAAVTEQDAKVRRWSSAPM